MGVSICLNPRDIMERTYATDLTWEIRQYRLLKAKILFLSYHDKRATVVYNSLLDAKIEGMIKRADNADVDKIDSKTLEEMRQQCLQQSHDITDRWSARAT
jgi:hypothetical protein